MAPNHRSHGVAGTDLFHNMFEWMATVGTAPAGPSPTAASSTSTRATDGTNTKENSRGRRRHRIRAGVYNTLNGNLAYGNLVDDVSVAAEGGDGGSLVTSGGFESPSLPRTAKRAPPALNNAATQRPAPASRRRLAA